MSALLPPHGDVATRLTTTTEVARTPVAPAHSWDEWGVAGLVVAGVVVTLSIVSSLLGIVDRVRAWFAEGEAEDDERSAAADKRVADQLAPINARVEQLASENRTFRSEVDLDRDFGLVRRDIEQLRDRDEERARRIAALEQGQARTDATVQGMATSIARTERLLEAFSARVDDKLDKLAASITKA